MKLDFNPNTITDLVKTVPHLTSFDDVQNWDNEAKKEIIDINNALNTLNKHEVSDKIELEKYETEHKRKGFFARILRSDPKLAILKRSLKTILEQREKISNLKTSLEELVERTPDDEAEAKQMLRELKLAKKELSVTKKEVRAEMRGVAISARVKNTNISGQIFTNGKLKRIQRISARIDKESSLKPLDRQIFIIDQQILEIDKSINWIEKIRF